MTCSREAGRDSRSGRPVFGEAPAGVSCRARPAAYVVVREPGGRVAVVRARAADGTVRCWLPGGESHPGRAARGDCGSRGSRRAGRAVRLTGRIGDAVQFFYAHTEQCWYEMAAVFFRGTFEGAPLGAGSDELSWLDPAREADSLFHACHAWAVGQAP